MGGGRYPATDRADGVVGPARGSHEQGPQLFWQLAQVLLHAQRDRNGLPRRHGASFLVGRDKHRVCRPRPQRHRRRPRALLQKGDGRAARDPVPVPHDMARRRGRFRPSELGRNPPLDNNPVRVHVALRAARCTPEIIDLYNDNRSIVIHYTPPSHIQVTHPTANNARLPKNTRQTPGIRSITLLHRPQRG